MLRFVIVCFLVCFHQLLRGQATTSPPPSDSLAQLAFKLYAQTFGTSMALYNGADYTAAFPGIQGSPFFKDAVALPAALVYESVWYPGATIAFDLVNDELVLRGKENIRLVPGKIDSLVLDGHIFIPLDAEAAGNMEGGLYELLFSGNSLRLLEKHKKQAARGFRAEDPFHFVVYRHFFIRKDGNYYPVDTEKELLSLFKERRSVLRKWLRSANLSFKKDPESALRQAVSFIDQLSQ